MAQQNSFKNREFGPRLEYPATVPKPRKRGTLYLIH